ncbi:hypothetical protein NDU88_004275 [Pleurodeles waltl]|uniref:Uncharacterized protein n=1 Tax=Pleurodeles waltl TaxID=8319 RepID=A0AAV7VHS6_PLEWA|nr:hypothetical protein NDU88_004275 [Pleurodeles waltl]
MLAQLLKQQASQNSVLSLRDQSGTLVHSQTVINKVFEGHLYTTYGGGGTRPDVGEEFLDVIDLPRLSDEDGVTMDDPINREKIWVALKQLKPSKMLGGDDLLTKFD